MDTATQAAVVAYLRRSAWNTRPCYICQTQRWEVVGHVTLSLADVPGQAMFGRQSAPCAAVICQTCGHTLLLNLATIGLVPHG
jgi:hypothetical protein